MKFTGLSWTYLCFWSVLYRCADPQTCTHFSFCQPSAKRRGSAGRHCAALQQMCWNPPDPQTPKIKLHFNNSDDTSITFSLRQSNLSVQSRSLVTWNPSSKPAMRLLVTQQTNKQKEICPAEKYVAVRDGWLNKITFQRNSVWNRKRASQMDVNQLPLFSLLNVILTVYSNAPRKNTHFAKTNRFRWRSFTFSSYFPLFFSSRYSSKTLNSRREIARGFETTIGLFDRRPNPVWSQPGEMAILFSGATINPTNQGCPDGISSWFRPPCPSFLRGFAHTSKSGTERSAIAMKEGKTPTHEHPRACSSEV